MESQPVARRNSNLVPYLKDGVVALGLLLAVAAVYRLDRGDSRDGAGKTPAETKLVVREVTKKPEPPPIKPLRLAVTPAHFDDMGKLLDSMGPGFKYQTIELDELLDKNRLSQFDVIFFTCGTIPDSWVKQKFSSSLRPGTIQVEAKQEVLDKVAENLKSFVNRGGTLYASDLRLGFVDRAFSGFVDGSKVRSGKPQSVAADVVDPTLGQLLGSSQVALKFDQPGWLPAAIYGKAVQVYLKGRYETADGDRLETPLLVRFPFGQGAIIFTSFHNEKQTSDVEQKLLKFLVFSVVTAKTESSVTRTMIEGGFSPASRNLLSASPESPSVTQAYLCKKSGPLQFALGFENRGASLKLKVSGPDGSEFEKEGTSTFTVDVPAAAIGEWKYTVTAVKVPYENFPFTLTIGEK
jgi:hypothetical protein